MSRDPRSPKVDTLDWNHIGVELDALGFALMGELISVQEARAIRDIYDDDSRFRSTVTMARQRFGEGEYRYFADPLPEIVLALKRDLYPRLLPIARAWWTRLGREAPWPETLDEWLEQCHAAGQDKPTVLLLSYGPGDWNALHRDLYGDLVFPLQVVINLNDPRVDHTGGEFLLHEQRPRAQSRVTAAVIPQGQGLVFTTRDRPIPSARGWSDAPVKHGVSLVRSGRRMTLGLVFHDAA